MAKEILVVPEEKLREVIAVIRAGLWYVEDGQETISTETRQQLRKWCDDEEKYLDGEVTE